MPRTWCSLIEDILRDRDILHEDRDAGIIHVYIGAESAEEDVLTLLHKGTTVNQNKSAIDLLRDIGIVTEASFMIGFPQETWDAIEKTIDSAIYVNPDVAVFPVVTPMPFTPIFAEMKSRIRVWDYSKHNPVTAIIEPDNMTMQEVTQALGQCYMKFYRAKMQEVFGLPDRFKKRSMMSALRLMMTAHGANFDFAGAGMSMPHPMPL